jgi:hypothetical protein
VTRDVRERETAVQEQLDDRTDEDADGIQRVNAEKSFEVKRLRRWKPLLANDRREILPREQSAAEHEKTIDTPSPQEREILDLPEEMQIAEERDVIDDDERNRERAQCVGLSEVLRRVRRPQRKLCRGFGLCEASA